jgi:hypothetical protein
MRSRECNTMWIGRMAAGAIILCFVMGPLQAADAPQAQARVQDLSVKELLAVVHDRELRVTNPDKVREAVIRLGDIRCEECVNDLIELLTFKYVFGWEKPVTPEGTRVRYGPIVTGSRYPATSALASIGLPALPALVEVVESHAIGSLESKNARYAIRTIFHNDPSKVEQFFKEAASEAPTTDAKTRLFKALEIPAERDRKVE